jgi:hypothetical protein
MDNGWYKESERHKLAGMGIRTSMSMNQIKNDIVGKTFKLVYRYNGLGKDADVPRTVIKINSVEIQFETADGRKPILRLPPKSLVDYDGTNLVIYEPGLRPLTPDEKAFMDNEPRDAKQEEIDALSDGSQMYHRRKYYYEHSAYPYLHSNSFVQGKYLTHVDRIPMIKDNTIKGDVTLHYVRV